MLFSRPRSEGWLHDGRTFSIYPCPLSFWLTLPLRVLSTSWCRPPRPCVVFLVCVHLAFFLASYSAIYCWLCARYICSYWTETEVFFVIWKVLSENYRRKIFQDRSKFAEVTIKFECLRPKTSMHKACTGRVKKVTCCTVIDISTARQVLTLNAL